MRPEGGGAPLLRIQLTRLLLMPLLALLTADAVVSYHVANKFAQDAYDKALVEVARELALQVKGEGNELRLDLPEAARRILLEDAVDTVYYELADRNGRHLAGDGIEAPPLKLKIGATGNHVVYDGEVGGNGVRAVEVRLPDNGNALVRVAETRGKRNELANEILASVVLPQVLLIFLAASLVWLGVARGLAPLDQLQRAVAARSHRDRSPLDERNVPGEVRPLITSINALLGRLDHVLTLQSRFIADAAHQLKTPVAGLKAQVELLAREPTHADIASVAGRLYVGVERLSRLVSQLLSLARNEPDAVRSVAFEPLDLNSLMLDIAAHWVPVALKRGIDLGFEDADRPAIVNGDAARLREMFDNLIDNAIRYSTAGGKVTVRVGASPQPCVSIHDDGPRIDGEDRVRIFERFHRLLGTGDGSGLGLAIAQEIAGLHNAVISLREDDHDGIGNVFSVAFPAPDSLERPSL